ncbi:MAG: hypothetical protein HFF69_06300 [Oscillospiraceae bacterium]|nr:hypothetical protein [Oscillospiraceae bacterium]
MSWKNQAADKLEREAKAFKGNKYESAMKSAVAKTLASFCCQNEEFAQAVVQGGSFAECMAAVTKGVGTFVSDEEAYRRAAAFYFQGAQVKMEPKIQLEPDAEEAEKVISLDFSDFFS